MTIMILLVTILYILSESEFFFLDLHCYLPACCLCQVVAAGEATVCRDSHARHHGLRQKPSQCELTARILWCHVDTVYKFYVYLFKLYFE